MEQVDQALQISMGLRAAFPKEEDTGCERTERTEPAAEGATETAGKKNSTGRWEKSVKR